jgi:hypothetical protein
MVLRERIELSASPLPRECSPAELCALRLRGAHFGGLTQRATETQSFRAPQAAELRLWNRTMVMEDPVINNF